MRVTVRVTSLEGVTQMRRVLRQHSRRWTIRPVAATTYSAFRATPARTERRDRTTGLGTT
jgi:hypothetical protein